MAEEQGALYILRESSTASSPYTVSFTPATNGPKTTTRRVHGTDDLIALLEKLGVDFASVEVREALTRLLLLGQASIPDITLPPDKVLVFSAGATA